MCIPTLILTLLLNCVTRGEYLVLIIRRWTNISNLSKCWGCMLFFMTMRVSFMSLAQKKRVTHTFYLVPSQKSILVTWLCILSLCENFQRTIVQYVGMLKPRAVVLDFEGFLNKSGFIVKELAIATQNFIDIISFLPLNSYRTLSSSDQKSHQWVSKFFHGLLWEMGEYLYCYLQQIKDSIILRFPFAVFLAKG